MGVTNRDMLLNKTCYIKDTILSAFRSFFGRCYGSTILFQDLLTFSIWIFEFQSSNLSWLVTCPQHYRYIKWFLGSPFGSPMLDPGRASACNYTIFWTNLSNLYHCYFMRNAISMCPCLSEDNQRHPSISESFVSRVAVLSEFLYMTSFHMTFNSVTHFFGWHVIKSLKMRQNELPHCQ